MNHRMDSAELRSQIAALRKRRTNGPAAVGLASSLAFIALALWSLREVPTWWMGILTFLIVGLMQYRMVMAAHEATHKTLFHPVWLNEALGLGIASLVGVSLFNYREAHLKHHKMPQSIQDDIDGYIYRPLLQARPGWPRLWLLISGNYRDILTKLRRKLFGDSCVEPAAAADRSVPPGKSLLRQLLPLALAQAVVWALFILCLEWWWYPVWWLAPIFVIALQVDRARTFLEHGYNYFFPGPAVADLAHAPQDTIDVATNALERYLFAPFGFAWHQAHHACLTVPFYRLPELAALLEQHQPGYHQRVRGSYPVILFQMLWARA